ncbi:MAG TPA: SPFH domain-containing protein [Candidatus Brocadiia bacterium]|nr:SPFH domain-containing protein [Candidatus Brocadiales bacterium]
MQKDFDFIKRGGRIPVKYFITAGIIVAFILTIGVIGRQKLSWKYIHADQIGVIVNNLTGSIKLVKQAGAKLYFPFVQDIYILDKSEQVMELSSTSITPERPQGNPVIVKTIDGGDVNLDISIHYRLVPDMAVNIIQDSGTGDVYKLKWIYDYARTICRYTFGELTIDEFPDSAKRDSKADKAREELNSLLEPHGILVTSVNLHDFRYYREYAERIQERRLADKEIEEQMSRAKAATENQKKVVVEEQKKKNVEVARFKGELSKKEIEAEAEAERIRHEADTYLLKTKIEADAEHERLARESDGILATKTAEAEGIESLKKALEGEGGRNLVKMEYAKRLREARIQGTPTLRSGTEYPRERMLLKEQPSP